jgi:hypothetical protein
MHLILLRMPSFLSPFWRHRRTAVLCWLKPFKRPEISGQCILSHQLATPHWQTFLAWNASTRYLRPRSSTVMIIGRHPDTSCMPDTFARFGLLNSLIPDECRCLQSFFVVQFNRHGLFGHRILVRRKLSFPNSQNLIPLSNLTENNPCWNTKDILC